MEFESLISELGLEIEELKKTIPRRVIDRVTFYECPACESVEINIYDSYCRCCGQKLEW